MNSYRIYQFTRVRPPTVLSSKSPLMGLNKVLHI
jgi:hypothetical protein